MSQRWTVFDFVMVWLGGILGSFLFFQIGVASTPDSAIVLGLAGQYVGNLGTLWLLARSKREASLGLSIEPKDVGYVGLGILMQFGIALLMNPLAEILYPDGGPVQQIAEVMADPDTTDLLRMALFSAAVLFAPLTEELIFRGVLLKALEPRGRNLAIIVTALVFSVVHLIGVAFDDFWAATALVIPPTFVLGLVLAWLTLRKGRLGPAIFLHSGWNLLAAVVLLLPPELLESVN